MIDVAGKKFMVQAPECTFNGLICPNLLIKKLKKIAQKSKKFV